MNGLDVDYVYRETNVWVGAMHINAALNLKLRYAFVRFSPTKNALPGSGDTIRCDKVLTEIHFGAATCVGAIVDTGVSWHGCTAGVRQHSTHCTLPMAASLIHRDETPRELTGTGQTGNTQRSWWGVGVVPSPQL